MFAHDTILLNDGEYFWEHTEALRLIESEDYSFSSLGQFEKYDLVKDGSSAVYTNGQGFVVLDEHNMLVA